MLATRSTLRCSVPAGQIRIGGGGASEYSVDAVRDSRWYGTFVLLPHDEGKVSVKMAIRAARKQDIPDNSIDVVEVAGARIYEWPRPSPVAAIVHTAANVSPATGR